MPEAVGAPGNVGVKSTVVACLAGTLVAAGLWVAAGFADNGGLFALAFSLTVGCLGILITAGAVALRSRHQEPSGGRLPRARR